MNNLTISLYDVGPALDKLVSDGTSPLIEMEMEPYDETPTAQVWWKVLKIGDRTLRLFACEILEDVPERVIEPDDFYNNYLNEIDGILNKGTKPSGKYTQAIQIYNLVQARQNKDDEPEDKEAQDLLDTHKKYDEEPY